MYISCLRNALLPFDSFSHEGNYIGTLLRHVFLLHTRYSEFGKKFSIEMFVNNTPRNSSFIEKKTPPRISLNLYSNRAHNFLKHLLACLSRHGASANFLRLSRDRATLGTIFTTTTRNLSACDVIMKMVYCLCSSLLRT